MEAEKINSLEEALVIIKEQDSIIGRLTRKVNYLEDTEIKRNQWRSEAMDNAGYNRGESFDKVWAETLEKSLSFDGWVKINSADDLPKKRCKLIFKIGSQIKEHDYFPEYAPSMASTFSHYKKPETKWNSSRNIYFRYITYDVYRYYRKLWR